jgi:hypothetical protein
MVVDGLILFKGHVFVAVASALLPSILNLVHSAGHEGVWRNHPKDWAWVH